MRQQSTQNVYTKQAKKHIEPERTQKTTLSLNKNPTTLQNQIKTWNLSLCTSSPIKTKYLRKKSSNNDVNALHSQTTFDTKGPCHSRKASLTVAACTHWIPKRENSNFQGTLTLA